MKWAKSAIEWVNKQKYQPWVGEYPVEIKFFLYRENDRPWDIDNVYCGTLDILQQTKIIINDTAKHVIPIFCGWAIDKENPRVEILIQPTTKEYFRKDLCKY